MPAHLLPISRRQFLAGSAAGMAALGQVQLSGDESTANLDSWALLSDTHLTQMTRDSLAIMAVPSTDLGN